MSSKRPTTRSLPLIVYLVIAVAALIGTGAGWVGMSPTHLSEWWHSLSVSLPS